MVDLRFIFIDLEEVGADNQNGRISTTTRQIMTKMETIPKAAMIFKNVVVNAVILLSSSSSLAMMSSEGVRRLDELIREDLQHIRDSYFTWLVISSVLVGIGVVLEGPELVHEIVPVLRSIFRRNNSEGVRHTPDWIKLVGLLGWVLVVVGVAGESIFEALEARADGILQTFNEILLTDAQKQASDAKTSAEGAANAAARAQRSADAANLTADSVANKAEKLDRQLAATKNDLDTAKSQLDAAETAEKKEEQALINLAVCLAPRVIPLRSTDEIGDVVDRTMSGSKWITSVDPLRPFAGREAIIEYISFDAEARRAALNIAESLKQAGWKVVKITPVDGIADGTDIEPYNVPLIRRMHEPKEQRMKDEDSHLRALDAADALVGFLHSYNWQAKQGWPQGDDNIPLDGLKVRVGLYPAVAYVSPPGSKVSAETKQQFNQHWREEFRRQKSELAKRREGYLKAIPPSQQAEWKARWERSDKEFEKAEREVEGTGQPCRPLNVSIPQP